MAKNSETAEAAVRSVPPGLDDKHVGSDPQSNLATVKVSAADMPDAEPMHKLAAKSDVFDPNAALRNAQGVGPGLQDSEAQRPAVWVDVESDEARKAAADAEVQAAQRVLDRAKARAEAIRKGEPLDQEAGHVRG